MSTACNNYLYGNLDKESYTIISRGDGAFIFDENGKRYLDGVGGVGVVNVGHGVSQVIDAAAAQARSVAFTYGSLVDNRPRRELAEKLQAWAPGEMGRVRCLFCSGGAEANEAALKIAYQYHWERGNRNKLAVIGRWQSYHGNTIGSLSMGGRTQWRRMYQPYLLNFPHIPPPYCYRCPWGGEYPGCGLVCAHELGRVIRQLGPENVSAFIAEPIIGTTLAAAVPPPEYFPIVRDICDQYDVLLIVDEVLTGVGRTGEKWGINHWDVTPDVITTAKGLSGGYAPLAAAMFGERVWQAIANGTQRVTQSYTFGGNPLSCATGLAVLNYVEQHDLVARAREMGEKLLHALRTGLEDVPYVGDVRGRGLLLGIELVADRQNKTPFPTEWDVTHLLVQKAFDHGLLVLGGVSGMIEGACGDHVQLSPPYVIEDEHVDFTVETIRRSILEAVSQASGS